MQVEPLFMDFACACIHIVQIQIMLGSVVCFVNHAEGGKADSDPTLLPCNEQG